MNGAITDPEVRTINPPSRASHMMIGKSQNFFLLFHKRPKVHQKLTHDASYMTNSTTPWATERFVLIMIVPTEPFAFPARES
jgi:hypothetical protein